MEKENTYQRLVKYLLGDLIDQEREQIERQYLADKDFFDELLAVEDDLMDEYLRGELSPGERQQFERHLLATPEQRKKLKQAQILREGMPAMKPQSVAQETLSASEKRPWFSFFTARKFLPALAVAFAILVLAVGGIWLLVQVKNMQNEVEQMQAERATAQQRERELEEKLAGEQKENAELLRQLQQEREATMPAIAEKQATPKQQTAPRIAIFTLVPNLVRGGGKAAEFVVSPDVEFVQLQVQVAGGNYRNYRAELQTADGESVYPFSSLKARPTAKGNLLSLRISKTRLLKRDYVLKVSGQTKDGNFEDAGFYAFRITGQY